MTTSIRGFIQQQVLLARLRDSAGAGAANGVLVVYDPDRRYRDLCLELASDSLCAVDASESSIESREAALAALQELGRSNTPVKELLVYVPARPPLTDDDRVGDPFALYAACGRMFPEGDGDEYMNLCLRYKPDYAAEIRGIFARDPNPSFEVIDRVGGGAGWPQLQALLHLDSGRELLLALLAPTEGQRAALKSNQAWVEEAKALCQATLGLKLTTRARTLGPVVDELWRYLLFSEFAFDLPGDLPPSLVDVPRVGPDSRPLVEDLCDELRGHSARRVEYMQRAEAVERELNLLQACTGIKDLGVRDTFPFEERSSFAAAVEALKRDDMDRLRAIVDRRSGSVWLDRGENQGQWRLLAAAGALAGACADAERQLPDHVASQGALLDFYTVSLRDVDRLQREFEEAAGDQLTMPGAVGAALAEAVSHGRAVYRRTVELVQAAFIRRLEREGWPPAGRLANADVFDKLVAPRLAESGRRVALLLVDALRYELGVELAKTLADDGQVDVQAACASLPTVTPVGMASLLPASGRDLRLVKGDAGPVPSLGGADLRLVSQRMDVLAARYGQRFADAPLRDFARGQVIVPANVELLVLRSNEMDSDFESNPEAAPGRISHTFQQVHAALSRLREIAFSEVVIATDHGFYLNTSAGPGDQCPKPPGLWTVVHERMLLGGGSSDAGNWVLPSANLGIRGDYAQAGGPRAMVAYRTGQAYFHGGASLQEAVVPVIGVRLKQVEAKEGSTPKVTLAYKRGARKITTRRPVVEVRVSGGDFWSSQAPMEILVEAQDPKGEVVGEAVPGAAVNPATRLLSILPGSGGATAAVTLKMDEAYEGKFSVKALDPNTLALYARLDLATDYTV